jgi:hypothetical protein
MWKERGPRQSEDHPRICFYHPQRGMVPAALSLRLEDLRLLRLRGPVLRRSQRLGPGGGLGLANAPAGPGVEVGGPSRSVYQAATVAPLTDMQIRSERGVGIRARRKRAGATWSMRALAVILLLLVLPALGIRSAAAEDFPPPDVAATGSAPGAITVGWGWDEFVQGINNFTVERENPYDIWNVNGDQFSYYDGGLKPDTTYRYKVCAYFQTEDADSACSGWVEGKTTPPQAPPQSQRPTPPRIVAHYAGQSWIRIKWEAYDYDSYFINITGPFGTPKGPRELRTIKYNHDGTRGDYTLGGLLPGRTYTVGVQGCTLVVFGVWPDRCYDWSPWLDGKTLPMTLHSGPDTCAPPFVWREAYGGDHVCVEVGRRKAVAADNAQAQARRAYTCTPPNCTFTAPDTCKVPYVWREARPSDHVCVEVKERTQVAAENASQLANQRRAVPR